MMYPDCPGECDIKLIEAKRAIELAEQEAEERMRKKAVDVILIALGVWMFIDGYDNLQKKISQ